MDHVRPLPSYLVQRYHGWRATGYAENRPGTVTLPSKGSTRARW